MKQLALLLPLTLVAALTVAAPAVATPDGAVSGPVRADVQSIGSAGPGIPDTPARDVARATKCPKGWFCVWPKVSYQPASSWLGGKKRGTCYTPFAKGHSVSNQIGKTIRVYGSTGCKGAYFDLKTGYGSSKTPFNVRSVRT